MPEKVNYYVGEQSLRFPREVYITASASVVGKKEGEGPLGKCFDMVCGDDKFGEDNWEQAESTLQKEALALAMGKGLWIMRFLCSACTGHVPLQGNPYL